VLALGWYVSRFQRFCRFAASDMVAGDEAFYQSTFAVKSVNIICEQLLSISGIAVVVGVARLWVQFPKVGHCAMG